MKIPVVKKDSVMKLDVSYEQYIEIKTIALEKVNKIGNEKIQQFIKDLQESKPIEDLELAIAYILSTIANQIEEAAKTQGDIEEVEIEEASDEHPQA